MIETRGYEESDIMIKLFNANIDFELEKLLEIIADGVIQEARQNLANHRNVDTGGLMGSIKIFESGKDYIVVGTDAPHAGFIEFGRGPIKPVRATVLRFFDKKKGKLIFTKYVGPTEPMPFMQPAAEKWANLFEGIMTERLKQEFKFL